MLNTFLRSAAHATDSTLIGCSANRAATIRLRQRKPVALCSNKKKDGVRRVQQRHFARVVPRD